MPNDKMLAVLREELGAEPPAPRPPRDDMLDVLGEEVGDLQFMAPITDAEARAATLRQRAKDAWEDGDAIGYLRKTVRAEVPGADIAASAGSGLHGEMLRFAQLPAYVAGQVSGSERLQKEARDMRREADEISADVAPNFFGRLVGAAGALPVQLMEFSLGGPLTTGAILGLQGAAGADVKAADSGVTGSDKRNFVLREALLQGTLGAFFARLGMSGAAKRLFGQSNRAGGAVAFNRAGLEEIAQEIPQSAITHFNDWYSLPENKDKPREQAVIEFLYSIPETAATAYLLGGSVGRLADGPAREVPTQPGPTQPAPVAQPEPVAQPAPVAQPPRTNPDAIHPGDLGAPDGVAGDMLRQDNQRVQEYVEGTTEAGDVRLTKSGNVFYADFGQGGKTAIVVSTPAEVAANLTPAAAWSSIGRNQVTIGDKTYNKGGGRLTKNGYSDDLAVMRHIASSDALKGVTIHTPDQSVIAGADSVIMLVTGRFNKETVREEIVHHATLRNMPDQDLQSLSEYLETGDTADLRNDKGFHEDVFRLYKDYLQGKVVPPKKSKVRAVLDKIRSFFTRILRRKAFDDPEFKAKSALHSRVVNTLKSVESGKLAMAPAAGLISTEGTAPGLTARAKATKAARDKRAREFRAAQAGKAKDAATAAKFTKAEEADKTAKARGEAHRQTAKAREDKAKLSQKKTRLAAKTATVKQRLAEQEVKQKALTKSSRETEKQKTIEAREKDKRGRVRDKRKADKQKAEAKAAEQEVIQRSRDNAARDRLQKSEVKKKLNSLRPGLDRAVNNKRVSTEILDALVEVSDTVDGATKNDIADDVNALLSLNRPAFILAAQDALKAKLDAIRAVSDRAEGDANFQTDFTRGGTGDAVVDILYSQRSETVKDENVDKATAVRQADLILRGMSRSKAIDLLMEETGFDPDADTQNLNANLLNQSLARELLLRIASDSRGTVLSGRLKEQFDTVLRIEQGLPSTAGKVLQQRQDFETLRTIPELVGEAHARLSEFTANQEQRFQRMGKRGEEARAKQVRERYAKFTEILTERGYPPETLLLADVGDANFQITLEAATDGAKASTLDRAAAATTLATRFSIFGPMSPLRILLANTLVTGQKIASFNVGAIANLATFGLVPSLQPYSVANVAAADLAALTSLANIPKDFVNAFKSGQSSAIQRIRNVVDSDGAQYMRDGELVFGSSSAGRLAGMVVESFMRSLGAVDQIGQNIVGGALQVVAPYELAAAKGLKRGTKEYADFIAAEADPSTRSDETKRHITDVMLDMGATRDFSGKGLLGGGARAVETYVNQSAPAPVRAALKSTLFPVLRGQIRGSELDFRNAPILSMFASVRDVVRAHETGSAQDKARAVHQHLLAVTASVVVPMILSALLDEDELTELAAGQFAGHDISGMPAIGLMAKAYGSYTKALVNQDGEAAWTHANDMLKLTMQNMAPGGRGVESVFTPWGDPITDTIKSAPLYRVGSRIYDKGTAQGLAETIAPVRDFGILFDQSFVDELDKKAFLKRSQAGFGAALGLRTPKEDAVAEDRESKVISSLVDAVGDRQARSSAGRLVADVGAKNITPNLRKAWVEAEKYKVDNDLTGINSTAEAREAGKLGEYRVLQRLRSLVRRLKRTAMRANVPTAALDKQVDVDAGGDIISVAARDVMDDLERRSNAVVAIREALS